MSDTDSKLDQLSGKPVASLFEQVLEEAKALMAGSDPDRALNLLSALERDYVRGVRLFALLGDIFLQRGETHLGIRYKVLHEVLSGTFRIAMEETRRDQEPSVQNAELRRLLDEAGPRVSLRSETQAYEQFMPATAAMGHELLRQGHFDQALQIFTVLLAKNPGDPNLKQARDHARKRLNEKKIVNVLQNWLGNLDKIKSNRSTGA